MRFCLAAALLLATFSGAGANLLVNGDFSSWDSLTGPSGWTVEYAPMALVERDGGTVRSAPYSARITRLVAGTGNNNGVKQYVAVTPGETYTLDAWCYDDDVNAGGGLSITWRDSDSAYIENSGTYYSDSSIHTWQRLWKTDTAPAGAAFADVKLRVYGFSGSDSGGVIHYDDASFDPGVGGVAEELRTPAPGALTVEPNPAPGRTVLSFDAPHPGPAAVGIYDLTGSLRTLIRADAPTSGRRVVSWDGTDSAGVPLASGLYFAVLNDPTGGTSVRKVVLQR